MANVIVTLRLFIKLNTQTGDYELVSNAVEADFSMPVDFAYDDETTNPEGVGGLLG